MTAASFVDDRKTAVRANPHLQTTATAAFAITLASILFILSNARECREFTIGQSAVGNCDYIPVANSLKPSR